jgi:hypothetical protein
LLIKKLVILSTLSFTGGEEIGRSRERESKRQRESERERKRKKK